MFFRHYLNTNVMEFLGINNPQGPKVDFCYVCCILLYLVYTKKVQPFFVHYRLMYTDLMNFYKLSLSFSFCHKKKKTKTKTKQNEKVTDRTESLQVG